MKGTKMQKGITLIALIITIIVLLVLAMVAIAVIQDSEILTHADRSAIMHEVGTISEKIRLESQAIKLETAQGGTKTQTVENALINLYADNNATPIQIEIESATSIPEGITAGKYYVVIPEYLDYNIVRGEGGKEAEIKEDTFVVDDEFNVYYILEGIKVEGEDEFSWKPIDEGEIPEKQLGKIYAIEDLVELSKLVEDGTFEEKYKEIYGENVEIVVTLERTLDFTKSESYRNPNDTTYGDLNGIEDDGNAILTEMTTGAGFIPIGKYDIETDEIKAFKGTFEGNNNVIYNLYINRPEEMTIGLFGLIDSGKFQNLGITGDITATQGYAGTIIGMSMDLSGDSEININNCYVKDTKMNAIISGGIVGGVESNENINIIKCTIDSSEINSEMGEVGGVICSASTRANVLMYDCHITNTSLRCLRWGKRFSYVFCWWEHTNKKLFNR